MTIPESQDKKTPNQIESEIGRTRSAISDDIRELGDRLSPEHLKQDAKALLRDAKEEATDMLRTAKNNAIESVTDTVHEISDRARRAGSAATGFAATHAVPLTLIGVGAGWLMLSLRRDRATADSPHRAATGEVPHRAATADLPHRAVELGHRASDAIMEVGHDASIQARRATAAAWDFTEGNPLAVGALAIAAGVGVGLLLPNTSVENSLMGPSRDRLVGDARHAAEHMRYVAKDAASELKDAIGGV